MSNDKQMAIGLVVPDAAPMADPSMTGNPPRPRQPIPIPRGRLRGSDKRAARQEAEQQQRVDEARIRESVREEPPPASMYEAVKEIDAAAVKTLVETLSAFVSRPMQVATVNKLRKGETSYVVQRCRACCAEIRSEVTHDWLTTLPHAIRHDYDSHRCQSVERQLHGCSVTELDQLHAELENEVERVSRRMVDVEKHLGLRKADGTKDDGR